jgi:hypothetical protein
MISESNKKTRWEFIESDSTKITIHEEDFGYEPVDYWGLESGNPTFFRYQHATDDAYVYYFENSDVMNHNYGPSKFLFVTYNILPWGGGDRTFEKRTYIKFNQSDIPSYWISGNSLLRVFVYGGSDATVDLWTSGDFDEDIITWNNKPNLIDLLYDNAFFEVGNYKYFDVGSFNEELIFCIDADTEDDDQFNMYSSEYYNIMYIPTLCLPVKTVLQNNSLLTIQDDSNDMLTVRSNYLNLELQENDKIDVLFNTTSQNKIELKLISGGEVVKTYELSEQGNVDFSTRTETFTIDEDLDVDHVEISGIFEDEANILIDNFEVYRYEVDTYVYNVDPDGLKQVYLEFPLSYEVDIYENGFLVDEKNITTTDSLQTLVYDQIIYEVVYVSFYDSNNDYLNFNKFKTYVNYTLRGVEYGVVRLSTNVLHVDKDSLIVFNVYDSFNTLVVSDYESYEQLFIDITLDVYSLEIKNEATEYVDYELMKNSSLITKSGIIPSGEIEEYIISSGNYTLNYTNYENEVEYKIEFEFTNNKLIVINSTYYDVYFSIFNFDGLGLDPSTIKFYINNERRDLGFNILTQDVNNIMVYDFFNASLFNQDLSLSGVRECNIPVEVYTLAIINEYNRTIKIEIERESSTYTLEQIIPSRSGLEYRFLPDIEYTISAYEINGTLLETETIELESQYMEVDFGFYQEEMPIIPEPFDETNYMVVFWVFIFAVILAIVGFGLYYRKTKVGSIFGRDVEKEPKYKPKKRGQVFDNRLIRQHYVEK